MVGTANYNYLIHIYLLAYSLFFWLVGSTSHHHLHNYRTLYILLTGCASGGSGALAPASGGTAAPLT